MPIGHGHDTTRPDELAGRPARLRPVGPVADHPCCTYFIGTFAGGLDTTGSDEAEIVLRGDLDARAVDRVGEHLAALLSTPVRIVTIDATAVDRVDAALLDLLSRTQHQLGSRRGLLTVRGLHPSRLAPDEHPR